MVVVDLVWLGVVGADLYNDALGPLRRPSVHWPAAMMFYVMYVTAIVIYCVRRTTSVQQAARHGAELGFLAYATYELTNWAVIADWPASLVPIDIAWGVVLTTIVGATGRMVATKLDAADAHRA
jgi:uncharacterized membrane protein